MIAVVANAGVIVFSIITLIRETSGHFGRCQGSLRAL